jgi:hypothetical protein
VAISIRRSSWHSVIESDPGASGRSAGRSQHKPSCKTKEEVVVMSANLNSDSDGSRTTSKEYHIGKIPEPAATSLNKSCEFLSDVLEVAVRLKCSVSACECTGSKDCTFFFYFLYLSDPHLYICRFGTRRTGIGG